MRSPSAVWNARRRERAQTGRAATVRRIKKACELAQGFCLTFFVIVLAATVLVVGINAHYLAAMSDEEWGDRTTWAERLYVDEPGRVSNPLTVPFGEWVVASAGGWQRDDALAVVDTAPLPYMVQALSVGGIEAAALFFGARFFGRIAKTGEPFRQERARELGLVAKLVLVLSIVPCLLMLLTMVIGRALLGSAWPCSYEVGLFSYGTLVCGFLLAAFAKVFEYGCILQQQDDELV